MHQIFFSAFKNKCKLVYKTFFFSLAILLTCIGIFDTFLHTPSPISAKQKITLFENLGQWCYM